jgi:hypothetical protein
MKTRITILLIGATVLSAYGQIRKSDLLGKWICENNDSLYYTNKYVTLYSDSTYKEQSNQCDFVEWTVKTDRFMFTNINKCADDGQTRMSMALLKHGIALKKIGRKRIIELTKGEEVYERFKVIEFRETRVDNNSRNIRILKLKRV